MSAQIFNQLSFFRSHKYLLSTEKCEYIVYLKNTFTVENNLIMLTVITVCSQVIKVNTESVSINVNKYSLWYEVIINYLINYSNN